MDGGVPTVLPAAAVAAAATAGPAAASGPRAAAIDSQANFEAFIPRFQHWVDFCNSGAAVAAAGTLLPLTVSGKAVGYLKTE